MLLSPRFIHLPYSSLFQVKEAALTSPPPETLKTIPYSSFRRFCGHSHRSCTSPQIPKEASVSSRAIDKFLRGGAFVRSGCLFVYVLWLSLYIYSYVIIYVFVHLHINILKPSHCLNSIQRQLFCINFSRRIQISELKSHARLFICLLMMSF